MPSTRNTTKGKLQHTDDPDAPLKKKNKANNKKKPQQQRQQQRQQRQDRLDEEAQQADNLRWLEDQAKNNPNPTNAQAAEFQRRMGEHINGPNRNTNVATVAQQLPQPTLYVGQLLPNGLTVPPPIDPTMTKKQLKGTAARKKDPWYTYVVDTIKHKAFKSVQFIKHEQHGLFFAQKLINNMGMDAYTGESEAAVENRKRWAEIYYGFAVSCHNTHRGQVVNSIKNKCDRLLVLKGGNLYPIKDILRMLKREFDPDNERDFEMMKWYWTTLIPAATGNAKDWGPDTHLFNCLHNGAPPSSPTSLYVTPSIEAFAVFTYEGNFTKFTKQHEVKKLHPEKKQVILIKDPITKELCAEDDVSDPFLHAMDPIFKPLFLTVLCLAFFDLFYYRSALVARVVTRAGNT
jgi:hypothetical protein